MPVPRIRVRLNDVEVHALRRCVFFACGLDEGSGMVALRRGVLSPCAAWTEIGIVYRCWPKIGIVYRSENPPAAPRNACEPVSWSFARALVRASHGGAGRGPDFRRNLYTKPISVQHLYTIAVFDHGPRYTRCGLQARGKLLRSYVSMTPAQRTRAVL